MGSLTVSRWDEARLNQVGLQWSPISGFWPSLSLFLLCRRNVPFTTLLMQIYHIRCHIWPNKNTLFGLLFHGLYRHSAENNFAIHANCITIRSFHGDQSTQNSENTGWLHFLAHLRLSLVLGSAKRLSHGLIQKVKSPIVFCKPNQI